LNGTLQIAVLMVLSGSLECLIDRRILRENPHREEGSEGKNRK
jgi:hypothetical protein